MVILGRHRWCGRVLGICLGLGGLWAHVSASSTYLAPPWQAGTFAGYTGSGSADGAAASATFNEPSGVAVDGSGNIYIADTLNSTVRKLTPGGTVSTVAGTPGLAGIADGASEGALFSLPFGLTAATDGTLYVADTQNQLIRKISSAGVVSTLAGTAGQTGSTNDTGAAARFNLPTGVALDAVAGVLYVADAGNHIVRKLVISSGVVTTLAGTAVMTGSTLDGTGTVARFNGPVAIALSADRTKLYVAEMTGQTIRQVVVATGVVTTLAGTANVAGSADGVGAVARFDQPKGLAVDGSGNLYVSDANGCRIRRIQLSNAQVVTVAGGYLQAGSLDGVGTAARFNQPAGLAYDSISGRLVMADALNAQLRSVDLGTAAVTTLAGPAVSRGSTDGAGSAARFRTPHQMARDSSGNLYVADEGNHTLRKITPAGVVTTLAGLVGTAGTVDGTGTAAKFNRPVGVAATADGATIYVSEESGQVIRKVTAAGVVTTLAGTTGVAGSTDGTGAGAQFNQPAGLAVDASGNIYVADYGNNIIRKITPVGVVTTFAGTAGAAGALDGTGAAAQFRSPVGLAFDASGLLYVADSLNQTIRRITSAGLVSTFAGAALANGSTDANTPTAARFFYPFAVAVDAAGRVYVADYANQTIRRIDENGLVRTIAGTTATAGGLDGLASAARFRNPQGIAVASDGSAVYVSDTENSAIRQLTVAPVPAVTSPATTTGTVGVAFSGYTITATRSPLLYGASGLPSGLAVNSQTGVITGQPSAAGTFVAVVSAENVGGVGTKQVTFTIGKGAATINLSELNPPHDGTAKAPSVTTVPAGLPVVFTYNGNSTAPSAYGSYSLVATINHANYQGMTTALFQISEPVNWSVSTLVTAGLSAPKGLAVGADGALYIADSARHVIYKRTTAGVVSVFAGGLDTFGYLNGTGITARFNTPSGLVFDSSGNLYVADAGNNRIRKITPAGVVSLLAGDGTVNAYNGTGGGAAFNFPQGLAISPDGALFVADSGNFAVRKVTLPGALVTTVNGSFDQPKGLAIAGDGTLYVSDAGFNNITKMTQVGNYTLLAGSGIGLGGSADGTGSNAAFFSPQAVALDGTGKVYVADTFNHTLRQITPAGPDGVVTTLAGLAGDVGTTNGVGPVSRLSGPSGLAFAADGSLYIADTDNGLIRRASPPLTVPVLSPLPVVTITEGAALPTYTFSASGSPTAYAASGLPPGLSLNSSSGALTGTPSLSGIYSISLSVTNSLTTVTTTIELTVNAPAWSVWQTRHFTSGQLANVLISGRAADPDGDGVPNLFEYLQDRDPLDRDNAPPALTLTNGQVALVYDQLRAAPGWVIVAEYSTDLQTWQRGSAYTETVGTEILDARRLRRTVRISAAVSPSARKFLRLVAEETP